MVMFASGCTSIQLNTSLASVSELAGIMSLQVLQLM